MADMDVAFSTHVSALVSNSHTEQVTVLLFLGWGLHIVGVTYSKMMIYGGHRCHEQQRNFLLLAGIPTQYTLGDRLHGKKN